jgi:hypothetical protein
MSKLPRGEMNKQHTTGSEVELDSHWHGRPTPCGSAPGTAHHWGLRDDTPTDGDRHGTARLWRIEHAARFAGMSANLLEAGIARGEIPVTMRRVGPGNRRFVIAAELKAWLAPSAAIPAEDFFQGTK